MNTETTLVTPTTFEGFPKIARLSRPCIVTEKIDGTNAQVFIGEDGVFLTGSRTQWITPQNDNHGFSRWAHEHKDELMKLGPGRHFGEWWGSGIQRGYGLPKGEKRWSLFNVQRWCLSTETPKTRLSHGCLESKTQDVLPACCYLVPVLREGIFDGQYDTILAALRIGGSAASPGFMKPEGIVVYHVAANLGFKKTLDKDEEWKGKQP